MLSKFLTYEAESRHSWKTAVGRERSFLNVVVLKFSWRNRD